MKLFSRSSRATHTFAPKKLTPAERNPTEPRPAIHTSQVTLPTGQTLTNEPFEMKIAFRFNLSDMVASVRSDTSRSGVVPHSCCAHCQREGRRECWIVCLYGDPVWIRVGAGSEGASLTSDAGQTLLISASRPGSCPWSRTCSRFRLVRCSSSLPRSGSGPSRRPRALTI